jgi:hypothetical protein
MIRFLLPFACLLLLACSDSGGNDGSCSVDTQCPDGRYCGSDGQCTFDCTDNSECTPLACNNRGRCGPVTNPTIDAGPIDATVPDGTPGAPDATPNPDANPFPGNNNPVASFTINPDCTSSNADPITFTSTSTEPDGDPMTCSWTFQAGNPSTATGCVVNNVTFPHVNPYTVTLTVRDNKNGIDTAQDTIGKCL